MEVDFNRLKSLTKKPALFEPGEPLFWNDPYISKKMLTYHLDQENDAASRKKETIKKTVDFLVSSGYITPGMKLLDLGCGPGLYAEELCKRGVQVTGVDFSTNSISYAKTHAAEAGLEITYFEMDFLDMTFEEEFDVVIQVYGEINVFSKTKRDALLSSIRKAMKKDGILIFDVTTRKHRQKYGCSNGWYMETDGFWAEGEYLALEQSFDYPEESTGVDQYVIIKADGMKVYRNWFLDYDRESITDVLENAGFKVTNCWSDLTGTPFEEDTEWIGLAARLIKEKGTVPKRYYFANRANTIIRED